VVEEDETTNNSSQGNAGSSEQKAQQDPNLIELDGMVENAEEQNSKAKTIAQKPEKRLSPRELKAKREAEHKAKMKAEKELLKKIKKDQAKTSGADNGKGKKMLVVVAIFAVIAGCFTFVYFKNPKLFGKKAPVGAELANVSDSLVIDTVFKDSVVETDAIPDMEGETPKAKATTTAKPEKTGSKKNNAKPASANLNSTCWLISYSSIASDAVAAKDVKMLADKGFTAGFYWIPDKNPDGKKLYKVYVGPFTTKADAKEKLPSVQALSPGAYILKLN